MVYSREIDGRALTLAPSGWTYGKEAGSSVFVLFDKQTESLWFPIETADGERLVGISGHYADRSLPRIEDACMTQQRWADWKATHPDTAFVRD